MPMASPSPLFRPFPRNSTKNTSLLMSKKGNQQLQERNEDLGAHLAAVEDYLGLDDRSQSIPADD
jgi:hypothetical protein